MTWLIALLLPIAFLLGYGAAARKKNTPASPEPDTQLLQKEAENLRAQLTQSEKMATLGHLTAGIAHEIKNPLNFVINFSRVSQQLLTELKELSAVKRTGTVSQLPGVEVRPGEEESPEDEDIREIIDDLERNITKINAHGHSIDGIVKSMLLHSRGRKGKLRPVDLNALLGENTNLVYHGMRALNPGFSVVIRRDFDRNIGMVPVVPRDFSRAYVNILTNACMAAAEKKESASSGFSPLVTVTTEKKTETIDIRIRDNGVGIPEEEKENIFTPFFTTRPVGTGTGLGLSIAHDIICKMHGGEILPDSSEGEYTCFTIRLPLSK